MGTLWTSVEFWVGAVVLLAYQLSKFSELSLADPLQDARARIIPNVRANDFAGRTSFLSALIVFLAATFALFFVACSISPTIIRGLAVISGDAGSFDKMVAAVPFPIYIAALYMGLTQPAMPIFSNITKVQRDIFHYWIGVPKRVLEMSDYFTNRIFARESGANGFKGTIEELTSDKWINKIDSYADTAFYRDVLKLLKVDNPRDLVSGGSDRELKHAIDQAVYAAALATMRKSGGWALKRLSDDLNVPWKEPRNPLRGFAPGAILAAATLVVLWFALPLAAAAGLTGTPPPPFWPQTLIASGQYLLSQSVPLLIAVALVLYTRRPADPAVLPSGWIDGLSATFERNLGPMLWAFTAVLVFDYVQSLLDYGDYGAEEGSRFIGFAFFASWAPYHILHATISMSACLLLLVFMDAGPGARGGRLVPAASMVAVITVAAGFYAVVRLTFQYGIPVEGSLSYVFLLVFLNVVAALLGLLAGFASARQLRAVTDAAAEGQGDAAVGPTVVPLLKLHSET